MSWFFTAVAQNRKKSQTFFIQDLEGASPLTQDVRGPLELLDQEMSGSSGDLQDLQVA